MYSEACQPVILYILPEKYSLKLIAESAMGAENPTMKLVHPVRKAVIGLYNVFRKAYSPPDSGIREASSVYVKAPASAINPPSVQHSNTHTAPGSEPASIPEVVKIPAPIILAITIDVTVNAE
jgi:hypothetical protein